MREVILRAGLLSLCLLMSLIAIASPDEVLARGRSTEEGDISAQDGAGSPDLDALAEAVLDENQTTGNLTAWAGGELSPSHASIYMPDGVEIGHKITTFAFPLFDGGVTILDRIGGPILINFWASWCGPCIDEFPELIALAQDDATPFTVLFLNVWDEEAQARAFLANQPNGIFSARDEGNIASTTYGLVAIPTSFLVDGNGILQVVHVGNMTDVISRFLIGVANDGR